MCATHVVIICRRVMHNYISIHVLNAGRSNLYIEVEKQDMDSKFLPNYATLNTYWVYIQFAYCAGNRDKVAVVISRQPVACKEDDWLSPVVFKPQALILVCLKGFASIIIDGQCLTLSTRPMLSSCKVPFFC